MEDYMSIPKGIILLTGPSCCGKSEISKALCKFWNLSPDRYLSMGDVLRSEVETCRELSSRDEVIGKRVLRDDISIFDRKENAIQITKDAEVFKEDLKSIFDARENFISQVDWLQYCLHKGLLVPDEWTVRIFDSYLNDRPQLKEGVFILDGYPRTVNAASALLNTIERTNISVLKVLHLFITKEQMMERACKRNRTDDTKESLERRYTFYIDKVQPCIDYLKKRLGADAVKLIDAHQPEYDSNGNFDKNKSIDKVIQDVKDVLMKCSVEGSKL